MSRCQQLPNSQNTARTRRFLNLPLVTSRARSTSLMVAFTHNLTPSETRNLAGVKRQQQPQSPRGSTSSTADTSVFLKADVTDVLAQKQFDVIKDALASSVHVLDATKYAEIEADASFSQRTTNAEIYDKMRGKIIGCLEKKRNYTQMVIGSGKTGKTQLLLNKPLLDSYGSPQVTNEARDAHAGLVQRALSDICTHLKQRGETDKEVMISIVGFHDDRVIDLLNLDQNIDSIQRDNLKIKSESNVGISVEDLIQMSIWSYSEFVSVYRIFSFMMEVLKNQIGMNVKAYAIQIAIAKVSNSKDFIERVEQKFTFVRVSNCQSNQRVLSNIGFCMGALSKRSSSGGCCVPYRSSRLTYYLKDCLTAEAHVSLVATISNKAPLKTQLATLQLARLFGKRTSVKKNYQYDHAFMGSLREQQDVNISNNDGGGGGGGRMRERKDETINEIVKCMNRYQAQQQQQQQRIHSGGSTVPLKKTVYDNDNDASDDGNRNGENSQMEKSRDDEQEIEAAGVTYYNKDKMNQSWKGKKRDRCVSTHAKTKKEWNNNEKENRDEGLLDNQSVQKEGDNDENSDHHDDLAVQKHNHKSKEREKGRTQKVDSLVINKVKVKKDTFSLRKGAIIK